MGDPKFFFYIAAAHFEGLRHSPIFLFYKLFSRQCHFNYSLDQN
jgi:hypothetical protein